MDGPFFIEEDDVNTIDNRVSLKEETSMLEAIKQIYGEEVLSYIPKPAWILQDSWMIEQVFYHKYLSVGYTVCDCQICIRLELPFLIKQGSLSKGFEKYHTEYFESLNQMFKFNEKEEHY